MKKVLIYLAAGHSKVSPGCVVGNLKEFEVNFKALQVLYNAFKLFQPPTVSFLLFKAKDTIYNLPYPHYLNTRIEEVLSLRRRHPKTPLIAIDIHHNSSSLPFANGIWFIVNKANTKAVALAKYSSSYLTTILQYPAKVVSTKELGRPLGFLHRIPSNKAITLILECGFLTGNKDKILLSNKLTANSFYGNIASALLFGTSSLLRKSKVKSTKEPKARV